MNRTPTRPTQVPAFDSRITAVWSVDGGIPRGDGPGTTSRTERSRTLSTSCAAAILAGGRATRLGGLDKAGLLVGGRRIVDRQLEVLRQFTPELAIIANDPARYGDVGVPVVPDAVAGAGPLGGLYTALTHVDASCVLIVACDMPFLSLAFLQHLVRRVGEADVAIPKTEDGYHPLCAVYARTVLPAVRARLAAARLDMVGLVREVRAAEIGPEELAAFEPGRVMLSNVNTLQDLRKACAWADRNDRAAS
jgi:molybdopterin-guanine dinucleotide biosynthesis protein A